MVQLNKDMLILVNNYKNLKTIIFHSKTKENFDF